jgi:nucleoside 2-deoxyribosyltransferase
LPFHAIATLSGGRRKVVVNKTEEQILTDCVIPFVSTGVMKARWGAKLQSYQVLELRVYRTNTAWVKTSGVPLEQFIGKAPNRFKVLEKRARAALSVSAHRVFIVMPIQGDQYGGQDEQRIAAEFDKRFEVIETLLGKHDSVAIRIDKEHTLDELVKRIKEEIERAQFVIADLTDERPSCYFEVGYAEALRKPVIYVASKESVVNPKTPTKIHFDIHRNINTFVNHKQLKEKLDESIAKNKKRLFAKSTESLGLVASDDT